MLIPAGALIGLHDVREHLGFGRGVKFCVRAPVALPSVITGLVVRGISTICRPGHGA